MELALKQKVDFILEKLNATHTMKMSVYEHLRLSNLKYAASIDEKLVLGWIEQASRIELA